jgi:hypothetical protein
MTKLWASSAKVTVDGKPISHAIYASEMDGYVVVRKIIHGPIETKPMPDGEPIRLHRIDLDFEIVKGDVKIDVPETASSHHLYIREREGGMGVVYPRKLVVPEVPA